MITDFWICIIGKTERAQPTKTKQTEKNSTRYVLGSWAIQFGFMMDFFHPYLSICSYVRMQISGSKNVCDQ